MAHSNGRTPTWPRTRAATARSTRPAWSSPTISWSRRSSTRT